MDILAKSVYMAFSYLTPGDNGYIFIMLNRQSWCINTAALTASSSASISPTLNNGAFTKVMVERITFCNVDQLLCFDISQEDLTFTCGKTSKRKC